MTKTALTEEKSDMEHSTVGPAVDSTKFSELLEQLDALETLKPCPFCGAREADQRALAAEQRAEALLSGQESLKQQTVRIRRELTTPEEFSAEVDTEEYARRVVQRAEAREKDAGRLAAALEEVRNLSGISKKLQRGNPAELTAIIGDIHQTADAALQSGKGDQDGKA